MAADVERCREELRQVSRLLADNELTREALINYRRKLVVTLYDAGVRKATIQRDIGLSYMVVTWDLKAMGR